MTSQNIASPVLQVNSSFPVSPSVVPSLVYLSQSSASSKNHSSWSRRQKKYYQRILSFCFEAMGRRCQLFRVDLTTAPGGESEKLRRHFQELRRRLERIFKFYIGAFIIETIEGNGVLHMVWSVERKQAVYIPQSLLSDLWFEIHGAPVVFIRRLTSSKADFRRMGGYLCAQYLAGQEASSRVSWSWWRSRVAIGKAWNYFKREARKMFLDSTRLGLNPSGKIRKSVV